MSHNDEAWLAEAIGNNYQTREELLQRIEFRYQTGYRDVSIGGFEYHVLRVADPDAILEEAVRSEESGEKNGGWEPYWAEAWDSAVAIGAWLVENEIHPKFAMDLGCGVGLAGCVAANLGAKVVLGDAAPPSFLFAKWNCWPWRERAEVRLIDWRVDRFEPNQYDWIFGADIIYARENWAHQNDFVRYHLAEGGTFLLAEPRRGLSNDFQTTFEKLGWNVEVWQYQPSMVERPLRMFRCQLS